MCRERENAKAKAKTQRGGSEGSAALEKTKRSEAVGRLDHELTGVPTAQFRIHQPQASHQPTDPTGSSSPRPPPPPPPPLIGSTLSYPISHSSVSQSLSESQSFSLIQSVTDPLHFANSQYCDLSLPSYYSITSPFQWKFWWSRLHRRLYTSHSTTSREQVPFY